MASDDIYQEKPVSSTRGGVLVDHDLLYPSRPRTWDIVVPFFQISL